MGSPTDPAPPHVRCLGPDLDLPVPTVGAKGPGLVIAGHLDHTPEWVQSAYGEITVRFFRIHASIIPSCRPVLMLKAELILTKGFPVVLPVMAKVFIVQAAEGGNRKIGSKYG